MTTKTTKILKAAPQRLSDAAIRKMLTALNAREHDLRVSEVQNQREAYQKDAQAALAKGPAKVQEFVSTMGFDGPEQQKVERAFYQSLTKIEATRKALNAVLGKGTIDIDKL